MTFLTFKQPTEPQRRILIKPSDVMPFALGTGEVPPKQSRCLTLSLLSDPSYPQAQCFKLLAEFLEESSPSGLKILIELLTMVLNLPNAVTL